MERKYWLHGEKIMLAEKAGISAHHMSQLLHRVAFPSRQTAERLVAAAAEMGKDIPLAAWCGDDHEAFEV